MYDREIPAHLIERAIDLGSIVGVGAPRVLYKAEAMLSQNCEAADRGIRPVRRSRSFCKIGSRGYKTALTAHR